MTAAVALLIDRLLYRPLRARQSSPIILAMASLGIAFIMRSLIYIIWGPQFWFYAQELRPAWEGRKHAPFCAWRRVHQARRDPEAHRERQQGRRRADPSG